MFCGIAITKTIILLLEEIMGYEIDFIGVKNAKAKKDADAIVLRWKENDKYVKGASTSQTDMTLTLVPQNSREIIINVSQLTEGNTFICKFIWYISF